jgi:hypothetical protein
VRFTNAVTALVLVATSLAVVVGLAVGLNLVTAVLLGVIVLLGALSVAVARKSDRGAVGPATCAECGGLISPNAPYCKHCGAPRS